MIGQLSTQYAKILVERARRRCQDRQKNRVRCVCGNVFFGHGDSKHCSEQCRSPGARRRQLSRRRNA